MNNAGLPGTGLGGLFCVILALVMPVRELYLTLRGRSSATRWRLALRQMAIAVTMIVATAAVWWALLQTRVIPGLMDVDTSTLVVALLMLSPALLLTVLVVVLRIWAWRAGNREPLPARAGVGDRVRAQ